jgi:hypothetical protein
MTIDGAEQACCGDAWQREYRRRVRAIMDAYRRNRAARVYYLTLPSPRNPANAEIVAKVNDAIVRAGAGVAGVSVLRMDRLFSPHGYQETLHDGGRDIAIREADGVHLNASGQAIAARETAKAIRGEPTTVLD